jgi:hypothetical protein
MIPPETATPGGNPAKGKIMIKFNIINLLIRVNIDPAVVAALAFIVVGVLWTK